MNTCYLLVGPDGQIPVAAAQLARLRDMRIDTTSAAGLGLPGLPTRSKSLIAMSFKRFESMTAEQGCLLRRFVQNGAVLYLRGGLLPGARCALRPFADGELRLSAESRATAYHCVAAEMVPSAMHYEYARGDFMIPGAETAERSLEPALLAHHRDGIIRPAIFALACGSGWVIFDLHPDDRPSLIPIVARLSDPAALPSVVGAMIAVDLAVGRDMQRPSTFNLVVDDRPANLDYFNSRHLGQFLVHLRQLCPSVHIDFAWTPEQTHPDRSYIEVLRRFDAGFVWHGLKRHVDHRSIDTAGDELDRGRTLVREIVRRYGVTFQHIMVFPFEKSTPSLLRLLANSGFLASVESVDESAGAHPNVPAYIQSSTPLKPTDGPLPILYRYSCKHLTRNRLLALAILGNPIIAAAHPGDLSLGRLSGIVKRGGSFRHFDEVLEFAAAKHLRASSLERIATEIAVGDNYVAPIPLVFEISQRQQDAHA